MTKQTLARYATVAAIVLVVGGLFAYQQLAPMLGGGPRYGVVDARASRPAVGVAAPDFVLQEAGTGRAVRLSDLRGRPVVLNFWATWCTPCRSEMPAFQQTYLERGASGSNDLVILGVDFKESNDQVAYFQKQLGLTFPLVLDREGDVAAHYGAQALPATYFIDRNGIVRSMSLGAVVGQPFLDGLRAAESAQ